METDAASFLLGETLVGLQRRIRDELADAKKDKKKIELAVLGAVAAVRALVEAFPEHGFQCHTEDFEEWRDSYLEWLDAHSDKFPLNAKHKKLLRENAVNEFERILKHCDDSGYRLDREDE
jgi:hypothetical protein